MAAEEKQASARASSRVQIRRVERGRRKYVTAVVGLELFGLELKRVAKDLGRKFATGSSVTRTPAGGEEIVVQGDVSEEIEEFLLERFGEAIPEEREGGTDLGGGESRLEMVAFIMSLWHGYFCEHDGKAWIVVLMMCFLYLT
ncbi:MAG TPA: DENR domain-containing protein [Caproicibacter sp.]|nr:DENR domain-containing protein [Caproicibacter sp.]